MSRPTGPEASRLRQRKHARLRGLVIPADALPGSLARSHTRCGKPTCHCQREGDPGHEVWSLGFMHEGERRVLRIPREQVDRVRAAVEQGRAFKEAVAEIFTSNALLLGIEIRQRRKKR